MREPNQLSGLSHSICALSRLWRVAFKLLKLGNEAKKNIYKCQGLIDYNQLELLVDIINMSEQEL